MSDSMMQNVEEYSSSDEEISSHMDSQQKKI